jgi:hypothetical protein
VATLQFLETLELNCAGDIFYETLTLMVKGTCLSLQEFIFRNRNSRKQALLDQIKYQKRNFRANVIRIQELERTLNDIIESELKEELILMRNFEQLHEEKITPYFMSLAKSKNNQNSLGNLKKENGEDFESKEERSIFITRYYSNLYS